MAKILLRDRSSRILGWYDIKYDISRDKHSRIVGKGNILATLLPPRP